jgi:high-affinity iron transporter
MAIPARYIFSVTTALIAFLAAGMAAQAVRFLNAAGTVTILERSLWDTSRYVPEDGVIGRILHTLLGYSDRPTELQLIAYLGVLAVTFLMIRYISANAPKAPAAIARA